jgi:outer membrane protein OmpA-like peptidoglycan-associated protein
MIRLAVPIILLLLMLLGGTWVLVGSLKAPEATRKPTSTEERQAAASKIELPGLGGETPEPGQVGAPKASFDVARIDPKGTSVFAGLAEPGASVIVMGDGKALGTAQAGQDGEWSLATEEKLASADPKLELKTKSAAQVQKEREEQARLAALSPQPTPIPPEARSAGAVASHLLKDLEGMVKDARTTTPPAAAGADTAAPTNLAAAPPPSEPGVHKSVPVPITFIFNEPTLTDDGRRAATLLLEYLRLKHFAKISLTGHADERGTDELNMTLSKERLDTVARFLKDGGFQGELELIPKGKREPFSGVVRSQYSLDDLYQLDRRVELVITQ